MCFKQSGTMKVKNEKSLNLNYEEKRGDMLGDDTGLTLTTINSW